MILRRRATLSFGAIVAASVVVLAPGAAASGGKPGINPAPALNPSSPDAPPAIDTTADEISSIGARYGSSYGGVDVASGRINLYIVGRSAAAASSSRLAHAVSQRVGEAPISIHAVRHSWAQLNNVTSALAAEYKQLRANGIGISMWAPDPTTNTVTVRLRNPSAAVIKQLHAMYPNMLTISLAPVRSRADRRASRFGDSPPWYEGDPLWESKTSTSESPFCTASFFFKGRSSGNVFGITAGHCGNYTWYTNRSSPTVFGRTSSIYFSNRGIDVQSIKGGSTTSINGDPYVWGSSGYYDVTGPKQLGKGDDADFDGTIYGEVPSVPITEVNMCDDFDTSTVTCHLDQGTSSTGGNVCNHGDSGGPVIQRISGSTRVYALGPIVGVGVNSYGDPTSSVCEYNEIATVLSTVYGTLLVAP